jgi:hypothetical protein
MFARLRRYWTPMRVMDTVIILLIIYVIIWSLHPSLVFSGTTITGGDTGSHFAMPAYLRTQGNLFDVTPWYPGWFAGIPGYTYYWILPDFLATLASYVISFAVAFKLVTILGSVLMPVAAYVMGKLFRAPRPVPIALALATLPFLFDASFTIDGGNLFSTMAGEYAFSFSLALSLIAIGLFARGVRTGRGYWLAALCLSATLAAHVLPWLFAIGTVLVLVVFESLQRRGIGDPNDLNMARGDYARPLRFAAGAGLLSIGLSAWWLLPFATSQNLSDSLGYVNYPVHSFYEVFSQLGWWYTDPSNGVTSSGGDRWVIVMAAIAIVAAFWVRDRLGMVLATLVVLSLTVYVFDPQSALFNQRLVPFWFISIHLVAGWLVGYLAYRWVRRAKPGSASSDGAVEGGSVAREPVEVQVALDATSPRDVDPSTSPESGRTTMADETDETDEVSSTRRWLSRTKRATVAIAVLGMLSTVPGLITPLANKLHLSTGGNQVTNWASTNYGGYQAEPAWPEYHNIITTIERVAKRYGCGRAMWEYNSDEGRFGTTEALMLLPYWTDNCVDSMEGLFFESSPTTAYHFLDQAELSAAPSDAQAALPYGSLDVGEGVEHLQMLGVKYYIAFSPTAVAQADADRQLTLVASTRHWPYPGATWRIYLVKNSPMVEGVTSLPNVVANVTGRVTWQNANVAWWLDPALWPTLAASSGPSTWPRATSVTTMTRVPASAVKVTDTVVGTQSISFHVSRVGVPVLVKISYFPRWHATGATGPFRVSPNLMVVVPTSKDVSLVYGSSPANTVGDRISQLAAIAGLLTLVLVFRRRRRSRRTAASSSGPPPATSA